MATVQYRRWGLGCEGRLQEGGRGCWSILKENWLGEGAAGPPSGMLMRGGAHAAKAGPAPGLGRDRLLGASVVPPVS